MRAPTPHSFGRPVRTRRARVAGFSLLELMLAVVAGGVLISAVYFASSRSSKTFQEQQRIAQTQLSLRAAMEQIRADAARAGFLASPNSTTDPFVCVPRPTNRIQAVRLTNAPLPTTVSGTYRGLPAALMAYNPPPIFRTAPGCADDSCMPDVLELVGSFDSPEEFHAQWVNTSNRQIGLQSWTQSFRRACPTATDCNAIFAPGRWIRVANTSGFAQFVQIQTFSVTCPAGAPCTAGTIVYTGTLQTTSASTACGVTGLGTGSRIGVLSGVRYFIGQVPAALSLANRGTSAADNTATKSDLIRERFSLPIVGGPVLGMSIALEYGVEFDVRFVVNTAPNNQPANLVVRDSAASETAAPENVRSMIVRVSARTRDEDDMWPFVPRGVGQPLTSLRVRAADSANSARVRSMVSEIALPNLIGPGQ